MAHMNQEQMAQADEGYDLSKLYIATKITPVYSEMLDQQFQAHTHVCRCNKIKLIQCKKWNMISIAQSMVNISLNKTKRK